MKAIIQAKLGIAQAEKFVPALLKVCESKQVVIENRQFKRINFLQGELTGTLNGVDVLVTHVLGFIEGYGIAVKLNKPEPKKLAPAK